MNQTVKWWYAQFFLGWHSFLHYLRKLVPWPGKKSGLGKFKENYVSEGLMPTSPELRKIAHEPSRCTACGLCDAACPKLNFESKGSFLGPRKLVISAMRGGPLIKYALSDLKLIQDESCSSCRKCEEVCPEKIPILELARQFEKNWQQAKPN